MTFSALAVLSGCTTVNTTEPAQAVAQKEMITDKRVITDRSLLRKVKVVGLNQSNVDNHLKIQVEVVNTTRSVQDFGYRLEWFDQNSMLISLPTSAYIPRQIEGKETIFITAVAPTPKAKDFRIKFIEH